MDAFGNIRPINFIAPVLIESSSLKERVCTGTDILIVRELSGGIYYGNRQEHDGTYNAASDLDHYDGSTIQRITRLAAWLAQSKSPSLSITSLDKANLLAACGRLWRGVVKETIASEFPNLTLQHMLIDTAAMTMALQPTTLNGIVLTSNMFGDIISDEASAIPGSLGLLPSASLCAIPDNVDGSGVRGIYEPVHGKSSNFCLRSEDPIRFIERTVSLIFLLCLGSAPDIAGKGIINPTGMILSVAMMLRYSLGMHAAAIAVENAVKEVIEQGCRTRDIGGTASTTEFGDAVVAYLKNHA